MRISCSPTYYESRNTKQNNIRGRGSTLWVPVSTSSIQKKVKCTLVQALRLCTGRTVPRGSRGIALPYHDHGTRRGWGVSVTPRPLFTPGKDPVSIVQEAGWAPGPVWMGAENLAPTGIRSPDRPARRPVAIPTTLPGPPLQVSLGSIFKNSILCPQTVFLWLLRISEHVAITSLYSINW